MAVAADFTRVVRDWLAAHVKRATVVILRGRRLWGYPQPAPTWGDGSTWQSQNPVQIEVE